MMIETFGKILSLAAGLFLILFYRWFARKVIESQNAFWGWRLGMADLKVAEVVTLLAGVGFLIFAVLAILNVIHYKN